MARIDELEHVPEGHLGIAVIGDGADSTLIAELQTATLAEMGVPAVVHKLDIGPDELPASIEKLIELGYRGVNIGNPHKASAARLAAHFFVVKHSLGVANALMLDGGVFAQNTEVTSFVKTLEGIPPGTALVLGAGHSGRTVAMGLLESGWKVRVWSRSALKARPVLTLLQRYGSIEMVPSPDPVGCSLIVNATPLGLRIGELPPLNWNHVPRGAIIYDLIVRRVNTELIRAANLRGLKTIDGKELAVEQAAQALEWWTGSKVPREGMLAHSKKRD